MREIKFRAWDKNRSKFYTSPKWIEFIVDLNGKLTARNFGFPHQKGYQQLEINQYTGLKDKNGVEIYEHMEIDDNFEVSFQNGCYVLTNISNGDIILLYNYLKDKNGQVKITKEYTKI